MKSVFKKIDVNEIITRIGKLDATSKQVWGKMSVAQMLAHCNVTYEMLYSNKHSKPSGFMKFILKAFVKNIVVCDKPYKSNSKTAPQFLISGSRNFEKEKSNLIAYIKKTLELGEVHFDGKESHSFGGLTVREWNNLFYKHLDHHLRQFSV